VFSQGLRGGFILDDFHNIVTNEAIQIDRLDVPSLRRALGAYPISGTGRPLATVSLAVNYWLGEKDPFSYKLTNLVIHAFNAWLVLLLLLRLLENASLSARAALWTGTLVALAWAVHPLQISSVLYVVQRMEILATTFLLLALLAYLKGRMAQMQGQPGGLPIGLSLVCMAVGMLSKESAVVFPALALSLELTVLGFRASRPGLSRRLVQAYLVVFLAALALFLLYVVPAALAPENYALRDYTAFERLLSQARVLPLYLGQILVPLPAYLTFYYDNFEPSRSLLQPWTTAAGLALLLAMAAAAWSFRNRVPLLSLGILWFFAGHALTSNVIALELVFEHRNYFPMLGILLSTAIGIQLLARKLSPELSVLAGVVLVLGFAGLASIRSATWGDEFLLATDLAARNAQSPRASSDLATIYAGLSDANPRSPFYAFAISEFERGASLPGSSPLPEQGLILLSASTGQTVKDEWWDSLVHKLRTRPIGPQEMMAMSGLMKQRYQGIELDDRRLADAYATMLGRRDMPPHYHAQFGDYVLKYLGDEDQADSIFENVARISANDPGYLVRIAAALAADGHARQARILLSAVEGPGAHGETDANAGDPAP